LAKLATVTGVVRVRASPAWSNISMKNDPSTELNR